jgi:hypothetical protein
MEPSSKTVDIVGIRLADCDSPILLLVFSMGTNLHLVESLAKEGKYAKNGNLSLLCWVSPLRYCAGMINKSEKVPTLKEVYPFLSDEELPEVEARIDRRIMLAIEMVERISADPEANARFCAALTKRRGGV